MDGSRERGERGRRPGGSSNQLCVLIIISVSAARDAKQ